MKVRLTSSQSLSRRQQVLGLGYCGGKSFQRAPVCKIHKKHSNASQFLRRGRAFFLTQICYPTHEMLLLCAECTRQLPIVQDLTMTYEIASRKPGTTRAF